MRPGVICHGGRRGHLGRGLWRFGFYGGPFFTSVEAANEDDVIVPEGFEYTVIRSSEDDLGGGMAFGDHNDLIAYFPIDAQKGGNTSCSTVRGTSGSSPTRPRRSWAAASTRASRTTGRSSCPPTRAAVSPAPTSISSPAARWRRNLPARPSPGRPDALPRRPASRRGVRERGQPVEHLAQRRRAEVLGARHNGLVPAGPTPAQVPFFPGGSGPRPPGVFAAFSLMYRSFSSTLVRSLR